MARHGFATLHSLALFALLATARPVLADALRPPAGSLATAAIDYTLFREGEVRRIEKRFQGWLLTCDVVSRLSQKFCSLRSIARSADGTTVAAVTISTDDRGRPAAMLTLPYGTLLQGGLTLSRDPDAGAGKARAKGESRILRPAQCGGLGCQIIWPMEPRDIVGLRGGGALRLAFRMAAGRPSFAAFITAVPTTRIEGRLDTAGFSDALDASMH